MKAFSIGIGVGLGLVLLALWAWPVAPVEEAKDFGWAKVAAAPTGPIETTVLPSAEPPRALLPTDTTTLVLRDPEGFAVGGAEIWVLRDGRVLASGWADDAGYFTCNAEAGEATVVAIAEGFFPIKELVGLSGSLVEIEVPDEPGIEAFLEIDGTLANGRFELLATSREIQESLAALPLAVVEDRASRPRAQHLALAWEGGARYRLRGLSHSASLQIRPPTNCEWRPGPMVSQGLHRLLPGVTKSWLAADTVPVFAGQVIEEFPRRGVPYALIRVGRQVFSAGSDGRFAVAAPNWGPGDPWWVAGANGQAWRRIEPPIGPLRPTDLGEFELAAARECVLRCVDGRGHGVSGVRISPWPDLGADFDWLPRTDASGAVTLRLPRGPAEVAALGPGTGAVRIAIPADAKAHSVALSPPARLEVNLRGNEPAVFPLFRLRLSADPRVLQRRDLPALVGRGVHGASPRVDLPDQLEAVFSRSGALSVQDLALRKPVKVEILDVNDEVVHREDIRLNEGEVFRINHLVDAAWMMHPGRVTGAAATESGIFAGGRVTRDGVVSEMPWSGPQFLVPGRASETVEVEIEGPFGPAPFRHRFAALGGGAPLEVAMSSEAVRHVRVVGPALFGADELGVRLLVAGTPRWMRPAGPGVFRAWLESGVSASVEVFGPGWLVVGALGGEEVQSTITMPRLVPLRLRVMDELADAVHLFLQSTRPEMPRSSRMIRRPSQGSYETWEAGWVPLGPLNVQAAVVDPEYGVASGPPVFFQVVALADQALELVLDP